MKSDSETIHQAAQFIAMAGKNFIPEKADDSHTNAKWIVDKNWLAGNEIVTPVRKIRVVLDYPLLVLIVADEDLVPIVEIAMNGRTRQEIFDWLSEQFAILKLDVSGFTPALHYEIPDHPVMHGKPFDMKNPLYYRELANYRTNGDILLGHFTSLVKPDEPVRVGPHHFDDGSYLPMRFKDNQPIASISLGMAVADPYYDEPYFYVTVWTSDGIDYTNKPMVSPPGKWHEKEWMGQVLTAVEIVKHDLSEEQIAVSYRFMEQAIKNAMSLIGVEQKT